MERVNNKLNQEEIKKLEEGKSMEQEVFNKLSPEEIQS